MRVVLFFVALQVSVTCLAQLGDAVGGLELVREKKYEEVEGTPYLFKEWLGGTITNSKGNSYTDVLLRYNIYQERIEFSKENKVFELVNSQYPSFTLNYVSVEEGKIKKLEFTLYDSVPGFKSKVYVQVLTDGKYKLLRKDKCFLVEDNVASYGTAGVTKRFQAKTQYFLKTNGSVTEVKNSKSSLGSLFPEHKELIKSSKLRDQDDLIALVTSFNYSQAN